MAKHRTWQRKTQMKQIYGWHCGHRQNDINPSNANMSSHTPAGQMMTFASEVNQRLYVPLPIAQTFWLKQHQLGDIHIHDDYYPTKTTTCIQYDMDDLFDRVSNNKNGSIRTPQSIQSYATLATIIFQHKSNEQHGGQAIRLLTLWTKGVYKSFIKHLMSGIDFYISS